MPSLKGLTHIRACASIFLLLFFSVLIADRAYGSADFSLTAAPTALALTQGGTGTASTLTVSPTGGFTGSVTFTNSALPSGVTVAYGTNPTTNTSTATFSASSSAALGSSSVTVTGTSGSLVHTVVITLYVVGTKAFSIHGTGTDGTQTVGSTDNNFAMVGSMSGNSVIPVQTGNAYVTASASNYPYPGTWFADVPGLSYWISPQTNYIQSLPTIDPVGYYIYEQQFNLNGFDPTTAVITGDFGVDNTLSIYLNGALKSGPTSGYNTPQPFTLSSGFVTGINTLDLLVYNSGYGSGLSFGITSATATVLTGGPTVATAATATPNPVTSNTTALSVLGAEGGNDTGLTYTWTVAGTPPASVTFSANGTNAAKNCTATFTKAGTYSFRATITDTSGKHAVSGVTVVVNQTPTTVVVAPATYILFVGASQTFTATEKDQFGTALTTQPTWTWSATRGTITSGGVYTAPATAGADTVTATDTPHSVSGTAAVTAGTSPAPTGLTATGGNQSASLSWTAPSGSGITYNVYRGLQPGAEVSVPIATGVSGTTYTDSTVTGGVTVYYQVTGVQNTLESSRSNEANTTTTGQRNLAFDQPVVTSSDHAGYPKTNAVDGSLSTFWSTITGPTGWIYVDLGATYSISEVDLNWQAAAGQNYTIQTAPDGASGLSTDTPWTTVVSVTGNSTSGAHNYPGLSGIGRYVRMNGLTRDTVDGYALYELAVYGTLISVPNAPTNLTATGGNNSIALAWTAVSGSGVTYNVYRGPSINGESATAIATGLASASYTDSTVTNGTPYFYKVTAVQSTLESARSTEATATPSMPAPPTGAVITVNTATPITGTTASLTGSATGTGTLTYAWSCSPSTATFSPTTGANTTLTFPAAGTYTVTLTGTDPYSQQTTATKSITVNQTITSIAVSPTSASLHLNGTQTFSANAKDQFSTALSSQPTFTWSVQSGGVGSVNSSGVYSAGTTAGTAIVQAASGAVIGTAAATVTNAPPTIATVAAASPSPVTGTTTNLSVLGADDGGEPALTYTWTYTGPTGVTFSANGTNAAKNTTATFTQAGSYTFTATIRDAGGLTATSAVTVTVNRTATTVTVSPLTVSLIVGAAQAFTASELDQFGSPLTPTWSWSATRGVVNSAGNYTAPSAAGSDTVTATDASTGLHSFATVNVTVNQAPTVATSASASPNPVTGNTTVLSVLGADDGGQANLTYTWSTTGTPPASVTFSENGDNTAKSTTATFLEPGTYSFLVTITDQSGLTVTSATVVIVSRTVSVITVAPHNVSLMYSGTEQFNIQAVDQFGNVLTTPPTCVWSVAIGVGIINSSGLFTAPSFSEKDTIQATYGTLTSTAVASTAAPLASNLAAVAGNASVTLFWTYDRNGEWYNVYRSTTAGSEGTLVYHSHIVTTRYTDTNVVNGQTYYYKMTAANHITGEGARSNEVSATPVAVTPPTTNLSSAQAIAAARAFCTSIGRSVSPSDAGSAAYSVPGQSMSIANAFESPCWWVTFEHGGLEIEVADSSGIIPYYTDLTKMNSLVTTPPSGTQVTSTLATGVFSTVIAASNQTDSLGTASVQYASLVGGSTAGDSCYITAQRMAQGYAYKYEGAHLVLQAETGAVLHFALTYPEALPATIVPQIGEAPAVSTAGGVLTANGITGATLGSPIQQWVNGNQTWNGSGYTPPASPALAWLVPYSTATQHFEVWVNSISGAVIGGEELSLGRSRTLQHAATHSGTAAKSEIKK